MHFTTLRALGLVVRDGNSWKTLPVTLEDLRTTVGLMARTTT